MRYIGIDPGLDGGVALLAPDENPLLCVMPTQPTGKGNGREVDVTYSLVWSALKLGPTRVLLERQQPFPKQGGKSNFTTGYNYGKLVALLEAEAVSFEVVRPQEWQRAFGIGGKGVDTKKQAALVAARLFPCVELRATERCRKPHSGKIDALLIAEHGRRKMQGGGS